MRPARLSLLRRRPARQTPAQILERLDTLRTAHRAPRIEVRGSGTVLSFAPRRRPVALPPDVRGYDPDVLARRQSPTTAEIRKALLPYPHLLAWSAPAAGVWMDLATFHAGLVAHGADAAVRPLAGPDAARSPEGVHRLVVGPLSAHQRLALAEPVSLAACLPSLLAYLPGCLPEDPAGACVRAGDLLAVAIGLKALTDAVRRLPYPASLLHTAAGIAWFLPIPSSPPNPPSSSPRRPPGPGWRAWRGRSRPPIFPSAFAPTERLSP